LAIYIEQRVLNEGCSRRFKREKIAGNWRTLHHDELHGLYCSPYYPGDNVK
jgi:hypothetical protein